MCNINCCFSNVQTKKLKLLLYIFTLINLLLSFIAIFIRAAKTGSYNDALLFLDERNKYKLSNYTLDKCEKGGTFKDDLYCEIDGKILYKPSENVSYQDLFKNFVKIELILNVLRTIITGIFFAFLYFIFYKYDDIMQRLGSKNIKKEEKEKEDKFSDLLVGSLIYLIALIVTSGIFILIRVFALIANNDIGLYEEGKQNEFEEKIAINYIIDIFNIVLNSIAICFVLRINRRLNQDQPIVQNQVRTYEIINEQPANIRNNFNAQRVNQVNEINNIYVKYDQVNINLNNNITNINNNFNNDTINAMERHRLPPINNRSAAQKPNKPYNKINTPKALKLQENDLPSKEDVYLNKVL